MFSINGNHQNLNAIFEALELESNNTSPTKSDAMSLERRMEGNRFFGLKVREVAIEFYNDSLCFANERSKHIVLAFKNRSVCYFQMNFFNECLVDINLAIKNNYTEHLMPKLDQRKAE